MIGVCQGIVFLGKSLETNDPNDTSSLPMFFCQATYFIEGIEYWLAGPSIFSVADTDCNAIMIWSSCHHSHQSTPMSSLSKMFLSLYMTQNAHYWVLQILLASGFEIDKSWDNKVFLIILI